MIMFVRGIGNNKIKIPYFEEDWSILGRGKTFSDVVKNSQLIKAPKQTGITPGQLQAKYYEGFKEGFIAPDLLVYERGSTTPAASEAKISKLHDFEPINELATKIRIEEL